MIKKMQTTLRSLAFLGLAIGVIAAARAQDFVYSNNNTSPNGVTGYAVGAGGVLTQVPGSPFATGGNGGGGGYFATRSIAIWGNFLFAANDASNTIAVFSVNSSTGVLTEVQGSPFALTGVTAASISLAVTPDGNYLFTGSSGITVQAISSTGALSQVTSIPSSSFQDSIDTIDVSPDGEFLAYTDTQNVGIFTIGSSGTLTAAPGSPISAEFANDSAASVLFTPNNSSGDRLYVGTSGSQSVVAAFSVGTDGSLTALSGSPFSFAVGVNPNSIGISPNGQYLYVADQTSGDVSPTVLSIASDGTLELLDNPGIVATALGTGLNIAASADGQYLYSGSFGGPIYDFNIGSNGALSNPNVGASSSSSEVSVAAYPAASGAPEANISPASLTFSSQQFGTESTAQTVTIGNRGAENLAISSIEISGTNANDFAETDDCTSPVATSSSCSVSVTFTPTAVGPRNASLVITGNSSGVAGTTETVTLGGTAIQQTPSLTVAPASVSYQSAFALLAAQVSYVGSMPPSGGVTFTVSAGSPVAGSCSGGSSPLTCTATYSTSALTVSSYIITATLAADANFTSASNMAQLSVTITMPMLSFAPIASQTYGKPPFTVSATSASSGAVTYAVVSGPATISGNLVTLTGAGTVTISANQAASGNYAAATATASFTVADPAFTLTSASSSDAVLPGGLATYDLTVTPGSGSTYPDALSLSVTGMPAGATATFSPATIAAGSGTTSFTLTVQTGNSQTARNEKPEPGGPLAPVALGLLLLPLAGMKRVRRRLRQMPRMPLLLAVVAVSLSAMVGLSGCGTNGFFNQAAKSYSVVVTAKDAVTGVQNSTNVTLTVQ